MPPPKKPKSGRTSLEQFLTEEERGTTEANARFVDHEPRRIRSLTDSDSNSPMGSLDLNESDGEVFDSGSKLPPRPRADSDNKSTDNQDSLFKRLFRKERSVDEQKVPGSPEQDVHSPTSSPFLLSNQDRISAFKLKYEEHIKYMSGKRELDNSEFFHTSNLSPQKQALEKHAFDLRMRRGSDSRHLSTEHSRLIDTLVASALSSSAAQSIIYSSNSVVNAPDVPASIASLALNRYRVQSDTKTSHSDFQPHDLSKRSSAEPNSMMNTRYFNVSNAGDKLLGSPYGGDWASRDITDVTVNRNKHYLDTHRHIVGLLSEREEERTRISATADKSPNYAMEKENIVQNIPARYPNGLYHPSSMNLLGNYNRFDPRRRDTLKNEDSNIVSQGGYLPVHSLMTHGTPQTPTSTTLDLGDGNERYHPAFLNPGLIGDGRRLKQEHSNHGTAVNKLCQVCNDNASGFHYGVWSCEGCKAFFKRSIQGPVDYVCPATNTCTIDKHRRKSCQACRLRKCYEVGMNKGSQRKDRKSTVGSVNNKNLKRPRTESGDTTGISSSSSPPAVKNPRKSRTTLVLEALSKTDLPSIESFHNHNVPPNRVHLLNSLVKLAEKELVFLINWAKNVPGYTDLSLGDQVHLIECCWMELLLLNCAFRSIENRVHGHTGLVFASDLVLDRPYWNMLGMCEILDQVSAVSEHMGRFDLHKDELLLLQATVLSNAEVRRLASYSKLHEIQQTILDSLVDIAQKYHPDNLRHIPSVLLLLTHIRQAAERATAFFQNVKREGNVEFSDLLTEMLDAQSDDKKSLHSSSDPSTSSASSPNGSTSSLPQGSAQS